MLCHTKFNKDVLFILLLPHLFEKASLFMYLYDRIIERIGVNILNSPSVFIFTHFSPVPSLLFSFPYCFLLLLFFLVAFSFLFFNSEYDFSEAEFWKSTSDLVAKTLIALQPTLALKYREMFPKKKKRGADGVDIEVSDEEEEEEEEPSVSVVIPRRRKSSVAVGDAQAAAAILNNNSHTTHHSHQSIGNSSTKPFDSHTKDPLRPSYFDQKVSVDGEDGDDSFRCFQVWSFVAKVICDVFTTVCF